MPVTFDEFRELDLVVARIIEAREHPGADRLLVLKIDIGGTEKQIVAGIRSTYSAGELAGKKIIVINNLEPVILRGEESNGMLLAASGEQGPVLLVPEKDVPEGTKIS